MSFKKLELIEPILKALEVEGYTTPTPIQEQAIPLVLERRDLLGCAQTGTGKTAAFAIPILQILHEEKNNESGPRKIKVLILTPTRELARFHCFFLRAGSAEWVWRMRLFCPCRFVRNPAGPFFQAPAEWPVPEWVWV